MGSGVTLKNKYKKLVKKGDMVDMVLQYGSNFIWYEKFSSVKYFVPEMQLIKN